MQFSELGLSEKVLAAVESAGYTTPTEIQAQAIPHVLAGRDLLGIAQTGTGKTASFVLPMITKLEQGRARARMPRTLILEPTRELAAQVEENFSKYGVNHPRLTVALLIGGMSFQDQEHKLDRGADVLIATPGRLLDHFERGKLLMTGVDIVVIDEADRMLDMGFIPDIERIMKLITSRHQTLLLSATMPPAIQHLADAFLTDPIRIEVAKAASTAKMISQHIIATGSEDYEKREVLRDLIRSAEDLKNAIIFCNRKRDVATLLKSLQRHDFNVGALHGDMDQSSRMATLDAFRKNQLTLLVASDVAARGLDIPDVGHVYNFDVPIHAEDYVHRIGRTGRAGRSGVAITLVAPQDAKLWQAIERLTGDQVPWIGEPLDLEAAAKHAKRSRGGAERGGSERGGRGRDGRSRDGRGGSRDGVSRSAERMAKPEQDTNASDAVTDEQPRSPRNRRPDGPRAPRPQQADRGVSERSPRPERSAPNEQRNSRPSFERPTSDRRPNNGESNPRRGRSYEEDDRPVVGLGDHMPAFLMRAPKIPKSTDGE